MRPRSRPTDTRTEPTDPTEIDHRRWTATGSKTPDADCSTSGKGRGPGAIGGGRARPPRRRGSPRSACWPTRTGPSTAAGDAATASARRLASTRRPDGSLGVSGQLPEPGWPTPIGLLLWSGLGGFELERSAASAWLLGLEGHASPRSKDDPMGHDVSIVGWPWVAGTHSWVEPSAMAMLALAREGSARHPRVLEGVRLLLDRAIPSGGWNLGNPVVFNTSLRPLPGPTGLALLALARLGGRSTVVDRAVDYLRVALAGTLAPVSLGWGLLGLRAWGASPAGAADRLAWSFDRAVARGPQPVELAMLLLAIGPKSLELLGVDAPARPPVATRRPGEEWLNKVACHA